MTDFQITDTDINNLFALSAFGESDNPETFFTGKPMVDGLGHTFLFRNYRASLAKWQTADPLGYPDGWNQLAYCRNKMISAVDFLGVATIEICSAAEGGASSFNSSGHSWIVYTDDFGNVSTYGTWGNNPLNLGNGLHKNLELGRHSDASRTICITSAQECVFFDTINRYFDMGEAAWSNTDPCSDFAVAIWESVTGEDISSSWFWDTPSDLRDAIISINEGVLHKIVE